VSSIMKSTTSATSSFSAARRCGAASWRNKTFGTPDAAKDNVIVYPTWYSGPARRQ